MPLTDDRGSLCFLTYVTGFEPVTLCWKNRCSATELYATYCDVLPQLLRNLLDHVIQHVPFLSSRELLRRFSRSALMNYRRPFKLHRSPRLRPPRTTTLPFLIPSDW